MLRLAHVGRTQAKQTAATIKNAACSRPCSDHRPSGRREGEPRWRTGGPADCPLGQQPRTQGLHVPGQVSDPLQSGGQQRVEGGSRVTHKHAHTRSHIEK